MLNISANEFRALLIDAGLMDEEDNLSQPDVQKRMQELKSFVEEMKGVKSALARLRRESSSNTTQVAELEGMLHGLLASSDAVEQLESKTAEVDTLQEQANNMQERITNLERASIQKEDQKREAVRKAQDLQYKINELQRDLDEANSGQRSAQQSQEGVFAEKKKMQDEIAMHKDRIRVLEGHLNDLQKKTERFRNETSKQHSTNVDSMNQTIESLTQANSELKESSDKQALEIVEYQQRIAGLEARIGALETEAGNLENLAVEQTKSGWLNKKSPNESFGTKFQKRFFVLKGVSLSYFKSNKDDLSKPLGTLFLDKSTITSFGDGESNKKHGMPYGIEISLDDSVGGKSVLIFAASEAEQTSWAQALNQAKDTAAGRSARNKNVTNARK